VNDRVLAGRYRLGSIIGQGGMAVVYRADDSTLGRPVAVKILRDQFASDPEFVQRFEREARSAARLAHPAIVQIYDVGVDAGQHFIVMELVEGEDLKCRIQRLGAQPPAEVIRLGREIAGALEFAHGRGLIHRDVKAQNVLVDQSNHVRLTDFGIAQAVDGASMTQTGTVLGTAQYMAPEQARGRSAGPGSDVYSLGVLLYELSTGRLPFEGDNALAVALRHVEEQPTPPRQLNPSVPAALDTTILKALAKDPAERFASAAELARALASTPDPIRQHTARLPAAEVGSTRRIATQPPPLAPAEPSRPTAVRRAPPASPPRPPRSSTRQGGGARFLVFLLGASLALVALGAFWLFAANRLGPTTPISAPSPTAAQPLIPAPTVQPVNTRPAPTAAPTTAPSPTAATSTPTATRVPPTASPAPVVPTPPPPPPAPVAVPNLVGLDLGSAQQQLSARGLILTFTNASDPRQPAGVVLDQTPKAGGQVAPGSTVSLVVNRPPPAASVAVPNVQGLEESEARKAVEKEGLRATVERGNGGRKGVVYDQSPQPGIKVPPGTEVKLSIGS
jgi:eukaryotic-like serine/threonine-protein kinase